MWTGALSEAQLQRWRTNGWLHLRAALDPLLVDAMADWVAEVASWADGDGPGLHHHEQTEHGPRLARSEDFDPHHRELSRLIRCGAPALLVSEVLGEAAVLFKEKINYKQPGGAGFAPHQDATAYRFVDHHVSCMVPIDPATVESGCLHIAPIEPALLPNKAGRIDPDWVAATRWAPVEVEPGDLVVFDSYTPHHSDTNRSGQPRRAMYLTYNRASAGDHRSAYYADKSVELDQADGTERVRLSVNDDFLGAPVLGPESRSN